MKKVLFNVLAKDLENAKEISALDRDRILVGVMVKNFKTEEDVVELIKSYMDAGVLTSVGLGAGDPSQWKKVADVAVLAKPYHVNQVFPAAGYTKGRLEECNKNKFLVNSLIEPSDKVGMVYISTGEVSKTKKEAITCELAAKLHKDIGLQSIKFYPIDGLKKIEHVRQMVRAAVKEGINIFEPTGGIDMSNVYEIVKVCLDEGAEIVIPHLYTSLIDKETGKTKVEYIKQLLEFNW